MVIFNKTNEFKEEFMKKIYSNDKELNEFLMKHFYIGRGFSEQLEVDWNIIILNNLNDGQKKVAKARLKQFEEDNDVSKYVPSQLALMAGVLLFWSVLFEGGKNVLSIISVLLCSLFAYLIINNTILKGRNFRRVAIYANSLLEDALSIKKRNEK